jgi:hypothetical protein
MVSCGFFFGAIRWRDADLAIIDEYAKAHDLSRGEALREIARE